MGTRFIFKIYLRSHKNRFEIDILEKEILYVDQLRWNKKDNDNLKLFK